MAGGDRRFVRRVGDQERRMLKARIKPRFSVMQGLGFFGMVGWAVAVPAALGVLLGVWLDNLHPGGPPWTISLFLMGLAAGVYTAWRWVSRQHGRIARSRRGR